MSKIFFFYLPQIDEVICSPSIASDREVTGLKLQNVKKGKYFESFEFWEWISSEKIEFKHLKSTWVSKGKSLRFMGQARVRLTFGTIYIIFTFIIIVIVIIMLIIMIVIIMLIIRLKEVQHIWEWSLHICSMMNKHFLLITSRKYGKYVQ